MMISSGRRSIGLAAGVVALLVSCASSSTTAPSAATALSTAATTAGAAPTAATAAPTTTTIAPTTLAPTTTAVPVARTVAQLLALGRPVVLAHAGGEDANPHSTLWAHAQAVKAGVDILDLDVQLTKDGVLVVQHDDTVDRTTNGKGKVADLTYEQIHALDNAYWFSAACTCKDQPEAAYALRGIRTGAKPAPAGSTPDDFAVATFRDLATRFPDKVLNIEIKGSYPAAVPAADELAKELSELGRLDAAVVTSFDDKLIDAFHEAAPTVELSPGLAAMTGWVLQGQALPAGMRILQLPPEFNGVKVLTDDVYARAKATNYPIWVWPNDRALENEAAYRAFLAHGVMGLNAAVPADAVAALRPKS
jgi:glycerophosphoryl diester phosphodiesterase